jgi:flagellar biosynthetic protein FlhB
MGAELFAEIGSRLTGALASLPAVSRADISPSALAGVVWADARLFAAVAGPPALVAGLVSISTSVAQTGWVYSPKALNLNWGRLNPAHGARRFLPKQGGLELVKAVIGVAALGAVSYAFLRDLFVEAPGLMSMTTGEVARYGWQQAWTLLWRASLTLAILAGADYLLQRWRWVDQLKMTRQEVKDEFKANDGNPEIKARVRKIQREMTRRRMLHAVKTATVVITNPTHFAVALTYRRAEMSAPVVVAKGQDHMAARIKAVAQKHGVPVVENVTLARALYKGAEIGDTIPGALFGAVAEVLAYLVRLKQLVL